MKRKLPLLPGVGGVGGVGGGFKEKTNVLLKQEKGTATPLCVQPVVASFFGFVLETEGRSPSHSHEAPPPAIGWPRPLKQAPSPVLLGRGSCASA